MTGENGLYGALSLCRKAGKLVMGFDAVCDEVHRGHIHLVFAASDLSPKTLARLTRACEGEAQIITIPLTQDDLCAVSHKPVGIYGVTDANLARLCKKHIEERPATNKEETANGKR